MAEQRTLARAMPSASGALTSAARPAARSGSGPGASGLQAEPAVSLCETLDRVLSKGIVAKGEITISVAGVDLLYVGLGALVASVDAAREFSEHRGRGAQTGVSEAGPSEAGPSETGASGSGG